MARNRRAPVFRKAGYKPPSWLTRHLKRTHPSVSLLWEPRVCRWCLVQSDQRGKSHLVRVLRGPRGEFEPPTLANTVGYLYSVSPHRIGEGDAAAGRFLERVDDPYRKHCDSVDRSARDMAREGSNHFYNKMRGRIIVPRG